jgi:hypothetical protein
MLASHPVYEITFFIKCEGEFIFFEILAPSSCFLPEIALQEISKGKNGYGCWQGYTE